MEIQNASAAAHEQASARVASLFARPWLRHYVAGKLRSDPVFPAAWEVFRHSAEPILDVGCGVGLLPFYLRERGFQQPIIGVDTDARKVREARKVSQRYADLEFIEHNVANELAEFRGNVALLDVLHYLPPPRQQTLLCELADRVPSGAALLLRDCPRDGSPRFWMTYAGEVFAQTISWNLGVPLHFPTRESINAPFREQDFTREETPAYGRMPFNNRLFTFRRRASAAVPGAGSRIADPSPRAAAASARGSGD
jgi:2-polyprenyl-3-methyl-5-hydroxy-6-metoxy-1,4-benzoquinol methylase